MSSPSFQAINQQTLLIADQLTQIARQIGKSPAQVAINAIRKRPGRFIPIIGGRTFEQYQDNIASLEWTLSEEHYAQFEEVSRIKMGFPMTFCTGPK